MIGKVWNNSDSETNTIHRMWAIAECSCKCDLVSSYGLGSFMLMVGWSFQLFLGRGGDFQELDHGPLLKLLTVL